ncbi:MAG TPA: hypothetical protein VGC27_04500 [Rhizomicrobium sp.]
MRRFAVLLLIGLGMLIACSRPAQPPVGRWIGNYDAPDVMVDVRLEITKDGLVRASAPDLLDVGKVSDETSAALRARLASDLAENWGNAELRVLDFDGRVFRKPGGVAPQMEWNPKTRQMTLVFYFGTKRSIRIPMRAVENFDHDPWAR